MYTYQFSYHVGTRYFSSYSQYTVPWAAMYCSVLELPPAGQ